MKRTLISLALAFISVSATQACSVCIAHALGAALHGIGAQTLAKGTKVISIGFLGFDKTNAAESGGTEHEHFRQMSADFLYGLTDDTTLTASVPYVFKDVNGAHSTGLGDASIGVIQQIKPTTKAKVLVAFDGSVKLPTGRNNLRDSGGALRDEHEQLGTGSTDFTIGASATAEGPQRSLLFAGISGRFNGENSRHYRYGNAFFYDLGISHPVDVLSAVVLELNGRVAAKDNDNGAPDDESGGHVMYLSLSYRKGLGKTMGLIATVQQPVIQNLNGSQHEGTVISISLSRMF